MIKINRRHRRLIGKLARLFVNRFDVMAEQQRDGSYRPREVDSLVRMLALHLAGTITLGSYVVNPENQSTKFVAFDLDIHNPGNTRIDRRREELRRIVNAIRGTAKRRGFEIVVLSSGRRGLHIYILFSEQVNARKAMTLGDRVLQDAGLTDRRSLPNDIVIERFPKQSEVGSYGFGNLLKSPLAKHQLSGQHSLFLDDNLDPLPFPGGQGDYLLAIQPNPVEGIRFPTPMVQVKKPVTVEVKQHVPEPNSMQRVLKLLRTNQAFDALFYAKPSIRKRYPSRSEAEFALCLLLLHHGFAREIVGEVLSASAIGKWNENRNPAYRQITLNKAIQIVASEQNQKEIA